MSTHELELTEPVDLTTPDGLSLNPAARGFSRRPLHRASLRGAWGRTKRWDYWAILAGDLVVSSVYADVDYIGIADVWWVDLPAGVSGGRSIITPAALGITLPAIPASAPLRARARPLHLDITDDADGTTHIDATWTERNGAPGRLSAAVALPPGHQSLNVVIPWSDRLFQFTSKHQARPAHGELIVGDRRYTFGESRGAAPAWGVLDVGRGRWPFRTVWNWGGGAGRIAPGGPVLGLQLGGKWTQGTGFTENGVLVDGALTKIGRELQWHYDWNHPLRPWRVTDPGGQLAIELTPRYDRHTRIELGVMGTETHQVFGEWSGEFINDAGDRLTLRGLSGFAEESRSRW